MVQIKIGEQPVSGQRTKESAAVLYTPVLDSLGIAITSGASPVGTVLTLDDLQQTFKISRTIAREVMRILESMKLVRVRRRVGIIVRSPDDWNVFDARIIRWRLDGPERNAQLRSLTELRIAIEPYAAAAAANNATAAESLRILELAAEMRRSGEAGELEMFLELDIEFHSLMLRASCNEMFAALIDVVAEVLAGRTHHGLMPALPADEALEAHERIAQAVADHDPVAAEAGMHDALFEVRDTLAQAALVVLQTEPTEPTEDKLP